MAVTVFDRFELIAPYDEDGVLRRWVARNLEPREGEPVLVSVTGMPPGVASSERVRQLASYEAELARQLRHPGISPTFQAGLVNNRLFFVTALPVGESWASLWDKALMFDDLLPVSLGIKLALEACMVMHHAHTQVDADGMTLHAVHGAIAPNRLYLSPDGKVVIGDFGIGRVLQKLNEYTDGQASSVALAYRAPEQVQEKAIGTSTDVFLLGLVLWEMLAMQRLYPEELQRRDIAIVTEQPEPPSNFNAAVTGTLDQAVLVALDKQPSGRYESMEAFAAALRPFERSMPMYGTVADYLEEQFIENLGQWRDLGAALEAGDLHGALLAARGTLLQATI